MVVAVLNIVPVYPSPHASGASATLPGVQVTGKGVQPLVSYAVKVVNGAP